MGFEPDSNGQCIESKKNPCPAGQIPSNGKCRVPRISISDCVDYLVNEKCNQCKDGKKPSSDGLSCVDNVNSNSGSSTQNNKP